LIFIILKQFYYFMEYYQENNLNFQIVLLYLTFKYHLLIDYLLMFLLNIRHLNPLYDYFEIFILILINQ
jgi:hypothetical protein